MLFLLCSPLNNVQKAILRSENTFFINDAHFTRKHFLSFKTLFEAYSKHVGTHCMSIRYTSLSEVNVHE